MSQVTFAAFECAALAAFAELPQERERLFAYGYKQGLAFAAAWKAKKVETADIARGVPVGVLLRMSGPTPDFIVGRIYDGAHENALKDVITPESTKNSQTVRAKDKFLMQNCRLLGQAQ